MPQLARAPASSRRPGALQQGGALYCACERQRATGATTHQAKSQLFDILHALKDVDSCYVQAVA
ncbi:hypothetical protein YJ03_23305 [Salmonella enterica subsp. enterica serovar Typhimurium]|uniref:hypothetical protein n=1 Tax=Escherichia coli TaxID=562 RepID=UPI000934F906|nr:hypothetical protein [Escherichia coli]EBS6920945.1 hypothetical protein [Salmonella enterica]ECM8936954.1 hypothetical protein [Salmonella enterica subsp. enterica serovar Typhimurium]MBW1523478.1 hypothetical protein [Escherichia coli]MDD8253779.1 hypothetical protein [Escherichia coli]MDD9064008.1 hypothetical protein [Escherichia coli]